MVEQAQLPEAIPVIAANLCATVLRHGKQSHQFGMTLDALREAMALTEPQLKVVAAWAAERYWIRWIPGDAISCRAMADWHGRGGARTAEARWQLSFDKRRSPPRL